MNNLKLAVVGSRYIDPILKIEFTDYELVSGTIHSTFHWEFFYKACPWYEEDEKIEIVSGLSPKGADKLAERFAKENKLKFVGFPAKWYNGSLYNPKAGFERNTEIVEYCSKMICFWNGLSGGTKDSINKCLKARKPLIVIPI